MRYFVLTLSISCLLLSCNTETSQGIHPDFDRLPKEDEIAYSVDLYDDETPFPIPFYPGPATERLTVGNNSLLTNEYYGIIPGRIDIDSDGRIYITQWTENTINVYSSDGHYLYSIGKDGHGPGEFIKVPYFIFDSTFTTLYALDRNKIEIFERRGEETFEYLTSFNHGLYLGGQLSASMCILGSNLYISGFSNDYEEAQKEMVHGINVIDLNSRERVTAFGYIYESYRKAIVTSRILSHMHITCNEETDTVVAQHHDFPFMFGYSSDGEQKWVSRIDNIISAEYPETKEGVMSLRTNENPYHRFLPFRSVNLYEYELVQVRYGYPQDVEINDPNYFLILVHSGTGKLYATSRYPIIGAIKNGMYVTVDSSSIAPISNINTLYLEKL